MYIKKAERKAQSVSGRGGSMEKIFLTEDLIKAIAENVSWKQEALHQVLESGYEIRLVKNDMPILLKDGETAFADNGIIGIIRLRELSIQAKLEAQFKS